MTAFHLTRKAKEDLKSIARFTSQRWGRAQRDQYLGRLDHCFRLLAENQGLGQACDDIRPGYRKMHEGRHVIFYRPTADGIEIVRILHGSMDVDSQMAGH